MADSVEGQKTSEFKLTTLAIILGAVLEGGATTLHILEGAGVTAPWMASALTLAGVLLQVAALAGYQRSRTLLKLGQMQADAQIEAKEIEHASTP